MSVPGAGLWIGGLAAIGLAFVLTGIPSRPLLAAGLWVLAFAALAGQPDLRRRLRPWTRQTPAIGAAVAFVLVAATAAWAFEPGVRRYLALEQLAAFTEEAHAIERDLAERAGRNPQGDITARVQDFQARLEAWVVKDLGLYYKSRLGTPVESPSYPPGLATRLRVFWDILETDLAAMEQFRQELSRWLFKLPQ